MRNILEDKTKSWKRLLTYSWVFEKWYEKIILTILMIVGFIKILEFFI